MKYKVGDNVCCIGESIRNPLFDNSEIEDITYGGFGWKVGLKFVIEDITNKQSEKGRSIYWNGSSGVYESHLVLCPKNCKKCKNRLHCVTL